MTLLGQERIGSRVYKYWKHTGDDGDDRITIETVEDAEPVIDQVKQMAQTQSAKSNFRYKASIPLTMIDEAAKTSANLWGVSVREAFSEIMGQKTDRAKKVLKILTDGRDYTKLQAKTYT